MDGAGDAYSYGRRLLKRIGWEIYLGGDRWRRITWVEVRGDEVLITVEDGTRFRAGYMDAVRLRRPGLMAFNPSVDNFRPAGLKIAALTCYFRFDLAGLRGACPPLASGTYGRDRQTVASVG